MRNGETSEEGKPEKKKKKMESRTREEDLLFPFSFFPVFSFLFFQDNIAVVGRVAKEEGEGLAFKKRCFGAPFLMTGRKLPGGEVVSGPRDPAQSQSQQAGEPLVCDFPIPLCQR
jgi:hypothetical protein